MPGRRSEVTLTAAVHKTPSKGEAQTGRDAAEGGFTMAKNRSFQDEIPPSRVNIRYHNKVTGQEKVELPLKLLLVGDYTFREDDTPLEDRKKISINKDNFGDVMREEGLKLDMVVANRISGEEDDEIRVQFDVDSLQAMTPDEVVKRIPELNKLMEVRELLTELKARVITNRKFRLALERIVKDQGQLESIMQELDRVAPLTEETAEAESEEA
jgi:type VI secretion system protein ImpB